MRALPVVLLAALISGCSGGSVGSQDAGPDDAGTADAGTTDGGTTDAGTTTDAGSSTDAGTTDGGLPGETCQTAEVLTVFPVTRPATTLGYANDYVDASDATCHGMRGEDRVYFVNVPAGQVLNAHVAQRSLGLALDPSISLILAPASNCDTAPPICIASDDSGIDSTVNAVQYANTGGGPQGVFIVISSATTLPGDFTLTVDVAPPPAGDVCSTATVLNSGVALSHTTANFTNDYTGAGTLCSPSSAGPDRVYSINVASNQRLTVSLTAAAGYDPSLSLVLGPAATCALTPRVCLANNNAGGPGGLDVAAYFNATALTQPVFVIVDSATQLGGAYSILATVDVPPAVGDQCQSPQPLPTDGGVLFGTTAGFTNDYSGAGTSCAVASGGPDRVYALTVPAGLRAVITIMPDAGYDPSLSVLAAPAANCSARACLSSVNASGASLPETASINSPLADGGTSYFVVVDSASLAGGPFHISAALVSTQVGDTCASAGPAITATTTLAGTTAGYANDYNPLGAGTNCTPYREAGRDRVYAVTLGPGKVLDVTVTPTGIDDPAVYLLDSLAACVPAPATCLGGSDQGLDGDAESFSYTNPVANGTRTVYLVVDSFNAAAVGYSLSVTIN